MWFGDLVTMRWFNDVWMKEVFANFMAGEDRESVVPEGQSRAAISASRTTRPPMPSIGREGTHPIRQQLANLNDAGSLYGADHLPEGADRDAAARAPHRRRRDARRSARYLRQFEFGNATWLDLVKVLDERTDRDLVAWSRAWVEEGGRPTIETHLAPGRDGRDGRIDRLEFSQSDPQGDRQLRWTEKLDVLVSAAAGLKSLPVELGDERVDVAAARGLSRVGFVLPTGGGLGYGNFVLDADSRRDLLRRVPELSDPVARGAAWVTLWEEMLDRRVAAPAFVDAVLQALPREDVQQNASLLVGYLRDAYWRFLPAGRPRASGADGREDAARRHRSRLERRARKRPTSTASDRSCSTPGGVAFLERVWAHQEKIPGLTLAEPDEATHGARPRGAWRAERPGDSRGTARAVYEPGSEGAVRVRDAGARGLAGDARRILRQSRRREKPPARAVGRSKACRT